MTTEWQVWHGKKDFRLSDNVPYPRSHHRCALGAMVTFLAGDISSGEDSAKKWRGITILAVLPRVKLLHRPSCRGSAKGSSLFSLSLPQPGWLDRLLLVDGLKPERNRATDIIYRVLTLQTTTIQPYFRGRWNL